LIRKTLTVLAMLIAVPTAFLFASDSDSWFDMENCAFCKNFIKDPGLLKNMTWENYNISNGIVSLTTVSDDYKDSYKAAMVQMGEVEKQLQTGAKLQTCNMCREMGDIYIKGAKCDYVETKHGMVSIMTASDPVLVTRLQAWSKRNTEELAIWEQAEKEKAMSKSSTNTKN